MKLKSITIATLAAIYASGVAAAASGMALPSGVSNDNVLRSVTLPSAEQYQNMRADKLAITGSNVKVNKGQNVHLQHRSVANKFKPEAGLMGEQVYIVELYGKTVLEELAQKHQLASINSATVATKGVSKSPSISGYRGDVLRSPEAVSIEFSVDRRQNEVLAEAAVVVGRQLETPLRFNKALNGFTTKMTQNEAIALARLGTVKKITRRQIFQLDTDIGPSVIDAPKVWSGETVSMTPYKGAGVIVGIIDTGINTDHPSFAATGDDNYTVVNPLGSGNYLGDCTLDEFAERCNDKLIGVYSYPDIVAQYSADEFQDPDRPWYEDPIQIRPKFGEDYNGHGSHTASTAAGNVIYNAPYVGGEGAIGDGIPTGFVFPEISGVAPHANIVAFQVCFSGDVAPWRGCTSDAMVGAIEDAIEAGVDVLNFSIGSSAGSEPWESPTQQAFLNAHEAGISVSASAGNSGTDGRKEVFSYIDNTSPWLLTVAASETGRTIDVEGKTLTGFSGGESPPTADIIGASISGEFTGSVVLAKDFGDKLCAEPFPAGTFTADQIVVCERGEVARVAKVDNVKAGGAGGFIMYNTSWSSSSAAGKLFDDIYSLPGIHISARDWNTLKPWLKSGTDHMVTITEAEVVRNVDDTRQDFLADFSSRGPAPYNPEHLVPAVTAPGVSIFAANSDDQPFAALPRASDWTMMSGTSMAAPHTAGALALVKEAHPNWTPQQIQSALQMTAEQVVTFSENSWTDKVLDAGVYRAGSGRINVKNAINTGLIMNETVGGFRAANPANGGLSTQLNLPELVNFNCKSPCTWIREVTATQDGTWSITTETSEYSIKLEATPETFTLKAGETQSVMITANITDAQSNVGNSEAKMQASVWLESLNPEVPTIFWPAVFKYDQGSLPNEINFSVNRTTGSHLLTGVNVPQLDGGVFNAAVPVKGDKQLVTIMQNERNAGGFGNVREVLENDFLYTVEVPVNSARLMVEVSDLVESTEENWLPLWRGDADIYVGIDLNGDGQPQWDEEAICLSNVVGNDDFCNIDSPEAGTYWVVIDNYRGAKYDDAPIDTFEITTAVVSNDVATNITVEGPSISDGITPADLTINWDLPEAVTGDIYYTAVMVGSDANNLNNIDSIATRITRGVNEFTIDATQSQALVDQRITVQTHVEPNLDGYDRDFIMDFKVPEQLILVEDSIRISRATIGSVEITDTGFKVTGSQESTALKTPEYIMSTNMTDDMCRLPSVGQADTNAYLDLHTFGLLPQFGGGLKDATIVDARNVWRDNDARISMFNNAEYYQTPFITINPIGYLQFDELPDFTGQHKILPFSGFPYSMMAPLWRGVHRSTAGLDRGRQYVPYNPQAYKADLNSGITIANTNEYLFVEWDNASMADERWVRVDGKWVQQVTLRDDQVDFEIIVNRNYNYSDGEHEIYMAYDNLDFGSSDGEGSIGLQSFRGGYTAFGPVNGTIGSQFSYGDLSKDLTDDLIVCYDYVGPESSQFEVTFDVIMKVTAAGQAQDIIAILEGTGVETSEVNYSINVPSSLTIGVIKDHTINEDSLLEGIMVAYADTNTVPNIITVTGEHISAIVNGNTPGSMFDIQPDANFFGETEVTVTVTDANNSGDKVSTSFMLIVEPMQDAATVILASSAITITEGATATLDASSSMDVDGDELVFSWDGAGNIADNSAASTTVSDLTVGSHTFTVTVSDGTSSVDANVVVTVEAVPAKKSSGGSMAWVLVLLSLAFRRNIKA